MHEFSVLYVQFSGLINAATLIGCNVKELKLALSTRKMRVGNDNIVQKLTLSQVRKSPQGAIVFRMWLPLNLVGF